MIFVCVGLMFLGGVFIITKLSLLVVLGAILFGIAIYLFSGLNYVHEQDRKVVEFFGKYSMTLKPGLQWLLAGAMKVRATISVKELEIPLFHDAPAKLDLKDGSIIPEGAKGFVKLKNPDKAYKVDEDDEKEEKRSGVYRAIYEIPDWKEFIEDRLENALRSYLNAFAIDDILTEGKSGFNLADHREDVGIPNNELNAIEKDLARWGFDLLRITITDFELPKEIVEARDAVQVKQREAEAARFLAEREAEETAGALIQMFCKETGMKRGDVEKELKENPEEFLKKYEQIWERNWDLIHRRMAIDGKSFLDARTQNPLLDLITLWQRMPLGRPSAEEKAEVKEKKEEKEELTEAEKEVVVEAKKRGINPKEPLEKWRKKSKEKK